MQYIITELVCMLSFYEIKKSVDVQLDISKKYKLINKTQNTDHTKRYQHMKMYFNRKTHLFQNMLVWIQVLIFSI